MFIIPSIAASRPIKMYLNIDGVVLSPVVGSSTLFRSEFAINDVALQTTVTTALINEKQSLSVSAVVAQPAVTSIDVLRRTLSVNDVSMAPVVSSADAALTAGDLSVQNVLNEPFSQPVGIGVETLWVKKVTVAPVVSAATLSFVPTALDVNDVTVAPSVTAADAELTAGLLTVNDVSTFPSVTHVFVSLSAGNLSVNNVTVAPTVSSVSIALTGDNLDASDLTTAPAVTQADAVLTAGNLIASDIVVTPVADPVGLAVVDTTFTVSDVVLSPVVTAADAALTGDFLVVNDVVTSPAVTAADAALTAGNLVAEQVTVSPVVTSAEISLTAGDLAVNNVTLAPAVSAAALSLIDTSFVVNDVLVAPKVSATQIVYDTLFVLGVTAQPNVTSADLALTAGDLTVNDVQPNPDASQAGVSLTAGPLSANSFVNLPEVTSADAALTAGDLTANDVQPNPDASQASLSLSAGILSVSDVTGTPQASTALIEGEFVVNDVLVSPGVSVADITLSEGDLTVNNVVVATRASLAWIEDGLSIQQPTTSPSVTSAAIALTAGNLSVSDVAAAPVVTAASLASVDTTLAVNNVLVSPAVTAADAALTAGDLNANNVLTTPVVTSAAITLAGGVLTANDVLTTPVVTSAAIVLAEADLAVNNVTTSPAATSVAISEAGDLTVNNVTVAPAVSNAPLGQQVSEGGGSLFLYQLDGNFADEVAGGATTLEQDGGTTPSYVADQSGGFALSPAITLARQMQIINIPTLDLDAIAAGTEDPATIEFWFYCPISTSQNMFLLYLCSQADVPANPTVSYAYLVDGSREFRSGLKSDAGLVDRVPTTGDFVSPYTWNHLAIQFEAPNYSIWLNGNRLALYDLTQNAFGVIQSLEFGGRRSGGLWDDLHCFRGTRFDSSQTSGTVPSHPTALELGDTTLKFPIHVNNVVTAPAVTSAAIAESLTISVNNVTVSPTATAADIAGPLSVNDVTASPAVSSVALEVPTYELTASDVTNAPLVTSADAVTTLETDDSVWLFLLDGDLTNEDGVSPDATAVTPTYLPDNFGGQGVRVGANLGLDMFGQTGGPIDLETERQAGNSYTLEFWFYGDNVALTRYLMYLYSGTSGSGNIGLYNYMISGSTTVAGQMRDNVGSVILSFGWGTTLEEWHHVAFEWDADNDVVAVFADGLRKGVISSVGRTLPVLGSLTCGSASVQHGMIHLFKGLRFDTQDATQQPIPNAQPVFGDGNPLPLKFPVNANTSVTTAPAATSVDISTSDLSVLDVTLQPDILYQGLEVNFDTVMQTVIAGVLGQDIAIVQPIFGVNDVTVAPTVTSAEITQSFSDGDVLSHHRFNGDVASVIGSSNDFVFAGTTDIEYTSALAKFDQAAKVRGSISPRADLLGEFDIQNTAFTFEAFLSAELDGWTGTSNYTAAFLKNAVSNVLCGFAVNKGATNWQIRYYAMRNGLYSAYMDTGYPITGDLPPVHAAIVYDPAGSPNKEEIYLEGVRYATYTGVPGSSNIATKIETDITRDETVFMDELRLTYGARYSGETHVVPTAPFPGPDIQLDPNDVTLAPQVTSADIVGTILDVNDVLVAPSVTSAEITTSDLGANDVIIAPTVTSAEISDLTFTVNDVVVAPSVTTASLVSNELPVTSGLVAHYDMSDLTTLFQDTAKTTPVTTTGQNVRAIDDKSGNGHTLTKSASATYEFTYNASGPKGLGTIESGGNTAKLDTAATFPDIAAGCTAFFVARHSGSFGYIAKLQDGTEVRRGWAFLDWIEAGSGIQYGVWSIGNWNTPLRPALTLPSGEYGEYAVLSEFGQYARHFDADGEYGTYESGGNADATTTVDTFSLDSPNCDMGEVIIYSGSLTDQQIFDMLDYIRSKWFRDVGVNDVVAQPSVTAATLTQNFDLNVNDVVAQPNVTSASISQPIFSVTDVTNAPSVSSAALFDPSAEPGVGFYEYTDAQLGSAVDPSGVSALLQWIDATDTTKVYQDIAGTTLATTQGDPVARINDKSGNNRHAALASEATRRFLDTAVVSGVDQTVASDNSSVTGLAVTNIGSPPASDKITHIAVVRKRYAGSTGLTTTSTQSGGGSGDVVGSGRPGVFLAFPAPGTTYSATTDMDVVDAGDFVIHAQTWRFSDQEVDFIMAGDHLAADNTQRDVIATSGEMGTGAQVMDDWDVMGRSGGSFDYWLEHYVFDGSLTEADLRGIVRHLKTKYSI